MYKRLYSACLVIASVGNQEAEKIITPFGEMRSRDGAQLRFTSNDAKAVYQWWSKDEDNHLPPDAYIYLENPTKSEVEKAFDRISVILSKYDQGETGIDLFFAGHGEYPTGALVLKDSTLSANDLLKIVSRPLNKSEGKRGLAMGLDSCYASSFLIDIVVAVNSFDYNVTLFDAKASSMYNEKAWELSFLEHGAFTFSFLNTGNQYVNKKELTRAIERNDKKVMAKYLQGMVGIISSPVAFLTEGRQHSVDTTNGHSFTVDGYGYFSLEVGEAVTREKLIEGLDKAKNTIWEDSEIDGSD